MAQLHRVDRPVPTLGQPTCQALTFSMAVGSRVFGRRPGLVRCNEFSDIRRAPGIGADAGMHFVGYRSVHLFAELT